MRSKKLGLRSSLKSRKNSKKLRNRRYARFEPLEARNLLAIGAGLVEIDTPGTHDHGPVSGSQSFAPQYRESSSTGFLSGPSAGAPLDVALSYLRSHAGDIGLTASDLDPGDFVVTSQHTSDNSGVTHIYLRQVVNGLEVVGADLNVNVTADGELVSLGSTFLNLSSGGVPSTEASLPPTSAYTEFANDFGFQFVSEPTVVEDRGGPAEKTILSSGGVASSNVTAEKVYVPVEGGGVELAWRLNVPVISAGSWYDVTISATDGETLHVSDWVSHASYNAIAPPNESPEDGGRAILADAADPVASPFGWHDVNGLPGPEFFDTRGNNVDALEDREGNTLTPGNSPAPSVRPNGGPSLNFSSPLDLTQEPITYTDAAVTNLFFWMNYSHDVYFRYGFTEAAGNFQFTNYTGQGLGGDAVLALAQVGDDLQAFANMGATFATPPDGQQPIAVFDTINFDISDLQSGNLPPYSPTRDFALDAGVIVHEYGHGVTARLTGGAANANVFGNFQSAALSEGWSDFFSLLVLQRPSDQKTDAFAVADYVNGPNPLNDSGIRRFAYSFDMSINPLTFADFNAGTDPTCMMGNCESHNAGEIWASALWDLNWLMIDKYGFDPDVVNGQGGNNLTMQLVMDGLKLQPTNPSFLDARDAILSADLILNDGVNHKEIWQAFARRGMGLSAVDDTTGSATPSNSLSVQAAFDLPTAVGQISGRVFRDDNGNGLQDGAEPGLPNWQIYIDVNSSGTFDPLEPSTQTDATGRYNLDFFAPGTFTVAQVAPAGFSQTFPAGNAGHVVTVSGGQPVINVDFGIRAGSVRSGGTKFHDLNGDGRREVCPVVPGQTPVFCEVEPGVPNVWIYVDYDNDARLDLNEPAAITDVNGNYRLTIDRNGTFFVREVMTPGWTQTFPGGTNMAHRVTVTEGSLNVALDFGNIASNDYGDAPAPYPTTSAGGGPVYPVLSGFSLGTLTDSELDGTPTAAADGDDLDRATSDEDGVTFTSAFAPGGTATVDILTSSTSFSPGRVNGWVDFNRDGDWDDPGEHVIHDRRAGRGSSSMTASFAVPADAAAGFTYARFTYGYRRFAAGEAPTGTDIAGEVEDYRVRILSDQPDAVDDQFRVDQNSSSNLLDVLDNDTPSANPPIFISQTSMPSAGGRVLISATGTTLRYTPPVGFSGVETFTYTIRDQRGATDTAAVSVIVVPDTPAIAVDDSFEVASGSSSNRLDVLANDLSGQNPPIQILDVVPSGNSVVSIDRNGTPTPEDDVLVYTPNAGFGGTDQFSYVIEDTAGVRDTATVTITILPTALVDDVIEFVLETTNLAGDPISAIGVGQPFMLRASVDDLRLTDGDNDSVDRRGIAAAYLDVLYDLLRVSISGDIQFGADYQNATSGGTAIPGLIDEVGGLQTGSLPLGPDPVELFSVPMIANSPGIARFVGDPADLRSEVNPLTPDHDTLTFQPASAVSLQGMRFTNAMLSIVGAGSVPVAVDNTFRVAADASIDNTLDVLGNDLDSGSPPLNVISISASNQGALVQIGAGGSSIRYRPPANFVGVDQFTYTVNNATGLTSSATVTVQVGDNAKSFGYRLETVPAGPVTVGSNFELRIYGQDLRADDGDGDGLDERGIFAAYTDILYDSGLVSTISDPSNPLGFQVTFSPNYDNGLSGNVDTPNVIDEFGSFQDGFTPRGTDEQLLATITLRASATGTASFQLDPADLSPLHDSLFFEPDTRVPEDAKVFAATSISIVSGASEGEGLTNPDNKFDVNRDGSVTPMDPLAVINYLNNGAPADAEGETRVMFVDVSGDGSVSPVDALQIINHLNQLWATNGEGEGGILLASEFSPGPNDLPVTPLIRLPADNSLPSLDSGIAQPEELPVSDADRDNAHRDPRTAVFADWGPDRDQPDAHVEPSDLLDDHELAFDHLRDGWNW